jgi:hypothetical protein
MLTILTIAFGIMAYASLLLPALNCSAGDENRSMKWGRFSLFMFLASTCSYHNGLWGPLKYASLVLAVMSFTLTALFGWVLLTQRMRRRNEEWVAAQAEEKWRFKKAKFAGRVSLVNKPGGRL